MFVVLFPVSFPALAIIVFFYVMARSVQLAFWILMQVCIGLNKVAKYEWRWQKYGAQVIRWHVTNRTLHVPTAAH